MWCLIARSDTRRDDGIALSLCASVAAFLGVWGGAKLKLDYSGMEACMCLWLYQHLADGWF